MQKLPIFTVFFALLILGAFRGAGAWQDGDSPAPSAKPPSGEQDSQRDTPKEDPRAVEIVRTAREQMFKRQAARADITQKVALGDFKFESRGKFVAAGGFRFRLEYSVSMTNVEGRYLEVCDGQILHIRRQIGDIAAPGTTVPTLSPGVANLELELSRRDIQKILRETRQHLDVPEAVHAAEIGIGGIPAVLASIERSMVLDAVREETVNGIEYVMVQGRWRPDRQQELLQGLGSFAGHVGQFLPDLVRVSFNKSTLFPEKFTYLKLASAERKSYRPILTIELTNVQLDGPVSPGEFAYVAPPGSEETDETMQYVQTIKQLAEARKPARQSSGDSVSPSPNTPAP